jgi:arylsulfatase
VRDNKLITALNDPEYQPKEFYYTEAISNQATRFIAEHKERAGGRPFFMYLTYTAAHWPMQAPERDIAKYKGKYDGGYEPIRLARWENAKRLGLIDPKWSLSLQAGDWSQIQHQAWEARLLEVYAAMIDNMDQGIGHIIAELKKQRQFDNTIIFYLQDNGGCAETQGRATTKENPYVARTDKPVYPPMSKEDQQFSSVPKQTRAGFPVIMGPGAMPGGPETYMAYGRGWANVSNTPFREYKHWIHEGGISTPLIVRWPKGIPVSRRNQLVNDPGHLIDLMATCVDLSGAKYPTERDGQKIHPLEGVSLRPVLTGKPLKRAQPIFWEHEGNRAVRDGRWKLVAKENQPWELYDIEADRTEMNNLAAKFYKKVKELSAKWDAWASRASVLPLRAWRVTAR